ncbi:MAG: PAS domain-containing protein [Bdellovibrionales bacterium]|nr:PAS domain-containing protein [Bdellovibrionales bacterium]
MDLDVFDNFLDTVFVIDKDRKVIYCNDSASVLTGISVKRMQKKKIFEIFSFENKDLFIMPDGDLGFFEKHPFEEVKFFIIGNEREGSVQLSITPLKQEDQVWLVVMHDVTLEEQLHVKYLVELNIKEKVIEDLKSAQKALEAYSKNLEQMVKERTKELSDANVLLSAIMNSLGQGFLAFDRKGKAGNVYTKACLDILETDPTGKNLTEILKIKDHEKEQFFQWVHTVFDEILPFESMVELGPKTYEHSEGRHITLEFYPIRDSEEKIQNLVLVATDNTKEYQAEIMANKEKSYSNMIVRLVKNKNQFANFLKSAQERLERLNVLSKSLDLFDVTEIFRILHTLEGESGAFGAAELSKHTKICQNIIEPAKNNPNMSNQETFEQYNIALAELKSVFQNFLVENDELFLRLGVYGGRKVEINERTLRGFSRFLAENKVSPNVIKKYKEEFLKESAEKFVAHYDEIIQTVAEKQGKKVYPLKVINGSLKISSEIYKPLFASLVHAFRNAVDHGIETPELRKMEGKQEQGKIEVSFSNVQKEGKSFLKIEIRDDGHGIDVSKIREKLVGEEKKHSDFEIQQRIFKAGLSSREHVGEFSGRGIGMDAIKAEVDRLGGIVIAQSTPGEGTQISIEVPENIEKKDLKKSA